jgi:hypothetical protein
MEDEHVRQTDLFSLLPGVSGGRALVQQHGRDHMQVIGQRGGAATRDRYGVGYLRELGRIGRQVRRDLARHRIRFMRFADGEQQKLVPYLPAKSRRTRPIWVRFVIREGEE